MIHLAKVLLFFSYGALDVLLIRGAQTFPDLLAFAFMTRIVDGVLQIAVETLCNFYELGHFSLPIRPSRY